MGIEYSFPYKLETETFSSREYNSTVVITSDSRLNLIRQRNEIYQASKEQENARFLDYFPQTLNQITRAPQKKETFRDKVLRTSGLDCDEGFYFQKKPKSPKLAPARIDKKEKDKIKREREKTLFKAGVI